MKLKVSIRKRKKSDVIDLLSDMLVLEFQKSTGFSNTTVFEVYKDGLKKRNYTVSDS